MSDLKALSDEMAKLKRQIETVLYISGSQENSDLSGLSDYRQIKSADDWQKVEEYEGILYKLDEMQSRMEYHTKSVKEVSRLHMNSQGRYETDGAHYYTSGSSIEFLKVEEIYNSDTGQYEDTPVWTVSRVEHDGTDYYIVTYGNVELSGLKVRVRG